MRKIRKLSIFGILGVVICALILFGISSLQANNRGKKPVKPPEANWSVQLPVAGIGTMLYGDGNMYENDDNLVRIKVEKGSSMVRVDRKRQIVFYYYFSFKLVNPTDRHAGFQNVDLTKEGNPDEGPSGIFPGGCEENDTTICMENFLNQDQPHSEYEYFNLKFQVGQHSFEQALGPTEGMEDMPLNTPVKFVGYSDWIKIRVQNQEDFLDPSTEYHNVECDERNYDDGVYDNMNIWIVKLDESSYTYYNGITSSDGVWRIYVGYNPYTEYSPGENLEDLLVQEQYTKRAEGKGKKEGTKTVTVVPLEAEGNFSFYIDFIKNPSTDGTQ